MEILLWPWIAHLYYVHQFWLVEGNDLNHLLESNQVGLFRTCSIVFERLIRPYTLPPHKKLVYIPNIKALALVVSNKKFFF